MDNGKKQLLRMSNIVKTFSNIKVLNNVYFDLMRGEVHVLSGENGAGKSTLMKILAGVHTEYDGSVCVENQPVRFKSVQDAGEHGISIIHQELSLVGPMSVYENIFLGREDHRLSWVQHPCMKEKARQFLDEMGLEIDVDQPVEQLSIGSQQMVEIAKALSCNSRVIIMDEPTSALTELEVEKLFKLISKLKQQGCGIIYISHKMNEIYQVADRITVLRDGEYIGTEKVRELPSSKLIKWMVGRELKQQFPRQKSPKGEFCFGVNNFSIKKDLNFNVKNVSFDLREGEILGIAGLQGSGNSELLNGIFGIYGKPIEGYIRIGNKKISNIKPNRMINEGVALLPNDRKRTGLIAQMDIIKNGTLAALPQFSPYGWLQTHSEQVSISKTTQSLNLKSKSLYQKVEFLSGGNQQKVVITKWIETRPKILLLDEPTKGVDIAAKYDIYKLMNKWTSKGMSIILITSEMPELLAMSDRILVMHRGSILAQFDQKNASQEKILSAALGETIYA